MVATQHAHSHRVSRAVAGLVAVLVLLIVADRVTARVADRVLAERIKTSQHLHRTPTVHIGGFPFLTQVIAGHYHDVTAHLSGLDEGGLHITSLTAHLHGVHLPTSSALRHTVTPIPVDRVAGDLRLTYAEINAALKLQGVDITVRQAAAGVTATGTVNVTGLTVGVTAGVSASATPAGVALTLKNITTTGLPSAISSLLGNNFSVTIPTNALPFGLQIASVNTTPTGLQISATAARVNLPGRP